MNPFTISIALATTMVTGLFIAPDDMMGTSAKLNSKEVLVGSMAMSPMKNIIENAVNSKDHTTLVAAVKQAGLVDALSGKGPFTVFAPVNSAFAKLPSEAVQSLMTEAGKPTLTKVLTYHVVSGKYDSKEIRNMIKKGNGTAMLKTLQGENLTFMMNGSANVVVIDGMGNVANIPTYDVYQSNGVIHVIDSVLMPK